MAYTVTLKIVNCASPMTLLPGAFITSGTLSLGATDANGERIIPVLDDFDYIITVSKGGDHICEPTHPDHHPGYIQKNFVLDRSQDGTIQTICLTVAPPAQPCGEGIKCFIVTAATGSSTSEEVIKLRQLRERVRSASTLGGALIDAIYNEYEQFSPKIAADLELDDLSRMTVLEIIVKPLFAWYTLAGKLALDHADHEIISQDMQTLLAAVPQGLGQHMLEKLELIQKGEALPAGTPAQLVELGSRIVHFPFASWAILDPLIRVYRLVTDNNDVVDEIAQWLANAPIEELPHPDDPNLLPEEFSALAAFFDFKPAARPQLGERLLAAWPEAALALEQSGFISNLVNKL